MSEWQPIETAPKERGGCTDCRPSTPGDCDTCGEHSTRLTDGMCTPCRDRLAVGRTHLPDTLDAIRLAAEAPSSQMSPCALCAAMCPHALCLSCLRELAIEQGADRELLLVYADRLHDAACNTRTAEAVRAVMLGSDR